MVATSDRDTAATGGVHDRAVEVEVAEVRRLGRTINSWQRGELAFFDSRASSAPTESTMNLKIKSVRHGFRNRGN